MVLATSRSPFVWGADSKVRRERMHPDIASIADLALRLSEQDFGIHSGKRTMTEQMALKASGASQTLHSKHLGDDDLDDADAADLVPVVDGKFTWAAGPVFIVMQSVQRAAEFLQIPCTWGGAWDRDLRLISGNLALEARLYAERRKAKGLSAFFDGVHLERRAPGT